MASATAPSSYSPAVPISVYRELATELKLTQTTLDALTQQNQQLLRQNTLLRTEIQRFVQSAEQLGHFAGIMPPEAPAAMPNRVMIEREEPSTHFDLFAQPPVAPAAPQSPPAEAAVPVAPPAEPAPATAPPAAAPVTERETRTQAIVPHPKVRKRDRPKPNRSQANKQRLFTEQPEGMRPLSKVASRSDMGNLWLATTILLVVVSAFGAGFLIMRPLLSR
ncbi:MAG: hypothetical protein ACFB0G_08330 [Leptolyngbyaceae cyanobacterium]